MFANLCVAAVVEFFLQDSISYKYGFDVSCSQISFRCSLNTVYVQIFEGCYFHGRSKSKVFVVLFEDHCYQLLSSICIVIA